MSAQMQIGLGNTPSMQVAYIRRRTILRLQSWIPRDAQSKPVLLAGQELLAQVGTTVPGPMRALCVGHREWLLISQESEAAGLLECLQFDREAQGLVLVDLSDGLATLELRGPDARDLLTKGCGLDMHVRMFPAGRCAQTRFAQIPLTIACLEEPPRFELYVARSYTHYLQTWIVDAAAEFDYPLG